MVVGSITYPVTVHGSYRYTHDMGDTGGQEMTITNLIIDRVCEDTGVTKNLLTSKRRNQFIVDAKQIVVFALSELGFTQQYIGNVLNYRDHTTVNHLKNKKCRQSLKNRLRASLVVKSYLDMVLYENACLRANMEAKLSESKFEMV